LKLLPSANISIASSNNSGVPLNLVRGGCEDNAVLYTTRRDYLKPADVFAILDKPGTPELLDDEAMDIFADGIGGIDWSSIWNTTGSGLS
jgi:hypothetical protein